MKIYYNPKEKKISLDSLNWKNRDGETEFGLGYWNLNEEEKPDWCSLSITKNNQYCLFLKKQPNYYYRDYYLVSEDMIVFQNLREIEKDQDGKWNWKK